MILDRVEAIRWALGEARPGDCVLLAGKGHETSQIIGQQRIPLDDADVARRWLYEEAQRTFGETASDTQPPTPKFLILLPCPV